MEELKICFFLMLKMHNAQKNLGWKEIGAWFLRTFIFHMKLGGLRLLLYLLIWNYMT